MVIGFRDDRCPACEYDLRTIGAGSACPECGRARQMA
jgi:predicted amidophosphoribosyltransferase